MKNISRIILILCVVSIFSLEVKAGGNRGDIGLGFRAGAIRFKSDLENPAFGPIGVGNISYNLMNFLHWGLRGGMES